MNNTYNQYLTEQAQKQSNNDGLNVYKVRKPIRNEKIIGYTNLNEVFARKTFTEECEK